MKVIPQDRWIQFSPRTDPPWAAGLPGAEAAVRGLLAGEALQLCGQDVELALAPPPSPHQSKCNNLL